MHERKSIGVDLPPEDIEEFRVWCRGLKITITGATNASRKFLMRCPSWMRDMILREQWPELQRRLAHFDKFKDS